MARKLPPDEERALIKRLSACDKKAFDPLYDAYYPRVVGWLIKHYKLRRVDALDVADETLFQFYRAVHDGRYDPDGSAKPATYLIGIARNQAARWWAHQGPLTLEADLNPGAVDDDGDVLERLIGELTVKADRIGATLKELELRAAWDRAVGTLQGFEPDLLARHYAGETLEEIAKAYGKGITWVHNALRQAKTKVLIALFWDDVAPDFSEADRELLRMRYLEGMTPRAMSEALGRPISEELRAAERQFLQRIESRLGPQIPTDNDHDHQ